MLVPRKVNDPFDDIIDFGFGEFPMLPSFKDFDDIDRKLYGKHAAHVMKTDVQEHDDKYEMSVDLPGFSKDQIKLSLKDGNLIINAEKTADNDKKDAKGKTIRQERYSGSMTRSFYVGENLTEDDIKAKFENGVLTLDIPKKASEIENKTKYIAIS